MDFKVAVFFIILNFISGGLLPFFKVQLVEHSRFNRRNKFILDKVLVDILDYKESLCIQY